MKDKVLTIEQMQELIDMGVDTSKASMHWISDYYDDTSQKWFGQYLGIGYNCKLPYRKDKYIPAFTLQDILLMLPNTLEFQNVYGDTHFEYIEFWGDGWNQMAVVDPLHPSSPRITTSSISPLRAAFDMLKWCKQNNYI